MKDLRCYNNLPLKHDDFDFGYWSYSSVKTDQWKSFCKDQYERGDWFMLQVGGKVSDDVDYKKGSHICFYNCKDGVRETMESIDWSFVKVSNSGQTNITAAHIVYAYDKFKGK